MYQGEENIILDGDEMKKKRVITLLLMIIVLILLLGFGNKHLTVTYYNYSNSKIPQTFDGYRIVQISDLHNASFGKDNRKLLKKIENLQSDVIFLTGDIVDANHTDVEVALSFVKEVVNISEVYYITGNHENWLDESTKTNLISQMQSYGVKCLANEVATITRDGEDITVIGLNDENLADATLANIVAENDSDALSILLAHEPQYMDYYAGKADLIFSGHAHGGQVRLLFIGGMVAPDQGFFPKYTEGEHVTGSSTMIISRGLGNSIIPLRIGNPPEIVCVDLQAE